MNHSFYHSILCRWYRLSLAGVLSLSLTALLLPIPPALADTFTVTFTIDLADITPGDSRCDAFPDGIFPGDQCTLRAAVQEANALGSDDTIILPAGVYTLTKTGGGVDTTAINDLDLNGNGLLTITGAGPTQTIIKGGPGWQDRLIEISGAAHKAQISGVTLQNGHPITPPLGGAISNIGVMTLTNVIVISNTAVSGGGISSSGHLTLINSTIISNTADFNGGGLMSFSSSAITLTNVTIVNNTSNTDNSGGDGGGIYTSGVITMANTILAGNKEYSTANDCFGTLTSQGYNLIQTTSDCTINGTTTGNITGQDPLISPLQESGGVAFVYIPLSGSPAIDTGNPAAPGSGGNACPTTDQRGVARPIGPRCDMGAVEAPLRGYLPLIIK